MLDGKAYRAHFPDDPAYELPPGVPRQLNSAALMEALSARDGHAPQFAWLKGHNHLSPVLGMGSRNDLLGKAILSEFRKYL